MAGYPDTLLKQDLKDPPNGGAPFNRFGKPSRIYIDAVMQFLEQAYLDYNRQPYKVVTAIISTGGVVGDGVCFDATAFAAASGYTLRQLKASAGGVTVDAQYPFGVLIEPVSAGAKARVAYTGVITQPISGLAPWAGGPVTFDATTGRLRAAVLASGELTYGISDPQGNVLLLQPARVG